MNIRETAMEVLKQVPPMVTSNGATKDLFTRLTGGPPKDYTSRHDELWDNWKKGGSKTTCNEFVGWYGAQLAAKLGVRLGRQFTLGHFNVAETLAKFDLAHAWVSAAGGGTPKFGDVFEHSDRNHTGISIDVDGSSWHVVQSGQGGPVRDKQSGALIGGCDIIKRDTKTFNADALKGWVDIEALFGTPKEAGSAPAWLLGWWLVSWRGDKFYYYFDQDRNVKYTKRLSQSTSKPIAHADDRGRYVASGGGVTIRWNKTGTTERFSAIPFSSSMMVGKWNDSEPLSASKI